MPGVRKSLYRTIAAAAVLVALPVQLSPLQAEAQLSVESAGYEWTETTVSYTEILPASSAASAAPAALEKPAVATFGPFRVVDPQRAEIVGSIESDAPGQFKQMLSRWPGLRQIDFVDCPGTGDDEANFQVARMLRGGGIATHVPDGGFAGSGCVELFLAGTRRSAAPSAEFAVHSWMDELGYQAGDYAADDPIHEPYLSFYRQIGMRPEKARAFYSLTNSVPFEDALYLGPRDIAAYIPQD